MWNGGDRKRSYRGIIPRELYLENRDCAERFFFGKEPFYILLFCVSSLSILFLIKIWCDYNITALGSVSG